jgi:hypothetical protein
MDAKRLFVFTRSKNGSTPSLVAWRKLTDMSAGMQTQSKSAPWMRQRGCSAWPCIPSHPHTLHSTSPSFFAALQQRRHPTAVVVQTQPRHTTTTDTCGHFWWPKCIGPLEMPLYLTNGLLAFLLFWNAAWYEILNLFWLKLVVLMDYCLTPLMRHPATLSP